jgi:hypothetical protein
MSISSLALPSIFPQVAVGGGGPKPRKLNPDSRIMALPKLREIKIMTGAMILGRISVQIIRK